MKEEEIKIQIFRPHMARIEDFESTTLRGKASFGEGYVMFMCSSHMYYCSVSILNMYWQYIPFVSRRIVKVSLRILSH